MKSTMQEIPFSVARILEFGATAHRNTTVATYFGKDAEITTFGHIAARAGALANALRDVYRIEIGDRVGTFLSNCAEHMESMLAVPSMGAIFHPLNRYLMNDQIIHVINHAEDKVIICDPAYSERLIPMLTHCPTVRAVILTGSDVRSVQLARALARELSHNVQVRAYEELLDGRSTEYAWPVQEETTPAAICYSTGTEGAPKGVVYSHRTLWLHALNLRTADAFGIRNGQKFLCCVPIYHILSWGVPLAAFMCGAPLVFTGRSATPAHIAHVITDAMPRAAHGSPAVWTSLLEYYSTHPPKKMSLQEIYSGGQQVPPSLIDGWEELYGVDMIHTWGMTETASLGTVAHPPAGVSGEARARYRYSQGRFPASLEYRLVDPQDNVLEINDRNSGELQVRGNAVTAEYYHSPVQSEFRGKPVEDAPARFTEDGWLRTGDVATINEDGFLTVHDRISDSIRSGGEWIYSPALENYLMESEAVVEAAVVGVPDDKWGQRPLAVIRLNKSFEPTEETARSLHAEVGAKVPRWMIPDYWVFVPTIFKTSVDKYDKKELRQAYAEGEFDVLRIRRRESDQNESAPE
ncbi:long-chain fatty-acid--CoA ligase [Corynebacterium dentalis]|uniref:long-chain fatty-acid--CoA ligase n=1 Tax=Corynebacterium dentalis TaxID=2014528 RepID=UPI000C07009F|nr:long-chain fatty-acid--CoA ligase [Corynebacterium dentalis]